MEVEIETLAQQFIKLGLSSKVEVCIYTYILAKRTNFDRLFIIGDFGRGLRDRCGGKRAARGRL